MPYIKLKLIEGRELDVKRELVSSVTESVCKSLNVKKEDVRIELIELEKNKFSIGGDLAYDIQKSDI